MVLVVVLPVAGSSQLGQSVGLALVGGPDLRALPGCLLGRARTGIGSSVPVTVVRYLVDLAQALVVALPQEGSLDAVALHLAHGRLVGLGEEGVALFITVCHRQLGTRRVAIVAAM